MLKLLLASTASATILEWGANPEANVVGYRVHYGPASRLYSYTIDVGLVTSYEVTNLFAPSTFFAVSAYDSDGLESDLSEEVFLTQISVPIAITRNALLISPEDPASSFAVYTATEVDAPLVLLGVFNERTIPITTGADPRRFFKVYRR